MYATIANALENREASQKIAMHQCVFWRSLSGLLKRVRYILPRKELWRKDKLFTTTKISNFRRFLSYYKPYRGLFAVLMFASVMTAAMSLVLPLCVRHITNNILLSGASDVLPEILHTGALMAAIIVVQTCSGIFIDWTGHVMGARIERNLRAELFAHYQKLPFSFLTQAN